jgi:hypothetical protein
LEFFLNIIIIIFYPYEAIKQSRWPQLCKLINSEHNNHNNNIGAKFHRCIMRLIFLQHNTDKKCLASIRA